MTNTRSARNMADDLNRGRARTKTTSQGFMALCPNHADKNPSLSIRETEGGRILLKCFATRSEEHTSELQSLMRISYAVFCLKKKKEKHKNTTPTTQQINKKNKKTT